MQNISWQQKTRTGQSLSKASIRPPRAGCINLALIKRIKDPLRVKRIAFALPVIVQCINRGDTNFPALTLCSVMKVALGNSVSYLTPDDFDFDSGQRG